MSQQQTFTGKNNTPGTPTIEFVQGNDAVNVGPDAITGAIMLLGDETKGVTVLNTGAHQETVSVAFATTSTPGVASFNPSDFNVVDGKVSLTGSLDNEWIDKATSFAAVSGSGYFITGTATATLPSSPSQGDSIAFLVDTSSILTIQANTGQKIRIGSNISASAGTCVNFVIGDSILLTYRSADTTWFSIGAPQGIWNIT